MLDSSWIELNRTALKKNLRYLKKSLGDKAIFTSVIKGNAYGHGLEQYLPLAEANGINFFAVFDAREAERALKVKQENSKIIIMGMIDQAELEWAIENEISFYVFELERLRQTIKIARKIGKQAKIHLELETGMYRTGFEESELDLVIALLSDNKETLKLEGLCTHLAGAESIANYTRIQQQIENYKAIQAKLSSRDFKFKYNHIACSAAALIYPDTIMDMARIGIAQYGYWPSMETKMNNLLSDKNRFTRNPLQRILSWKSRIMNVKKVPAGKFISYGHSFMATKEMKVASVPIGYSHGYRRSLSNIGKVLVKGYRANVIGIVNMNIFQINVSNIPGIQSGDEVVIIGTQGKNHISVSSFSELTNQINYEFLSRLPVNIPRIICS